MYELRPYQKEAVDAAVGHFRKQRQPCVVVLPTGAGKSLVIAELARIAKGRVLVLAHVKELVDQNYHKYRSLQLEAGAGIGIIGNVISNDGVVGLSGAGSIVVTDNGDGTYTVVADLWWGTNATSYRFLENGVEVGAGSLVAASPGAQQAKLPVSGKPAGAYVYVVEFTNAAGTATSKELTVTVK